MKQQRSPFIEGFKQPTLTKNSYITLADVRGDGQGKLVIWSDEQRQIIVYKGSNREVQKPSKIKNTSGILQFNDQQRNPKAVIGISAQNCLYIFRSLNESFRLRIPDIIAKQQEQMIWTENQLNLQRLTDRLLQLPRKMLSETARHFISASTNQRKQQLIQKVFSQGINQKDSISAMTVLRETSSSVGNVIIGTQLNRLYILDNYGHSIICQKVIDQVPSILLAHGTYNENHIIISIDRQGQMCLFLKADREDPSERVKLSARVISASLVYPDLLICTQDQVITHFMITNSNSKLKTKKYSFKLPKQPIKVLLFDYKGTKVSIILFQDQIRLYNERLMIYSYFPIYRMYDILFGSFAKQENCLILMYENHGFEVLILHRQFNLKTQYPSNKAIVAETQEIQIPKKTTQFKSYWSEQKDQQSAISSYKLYQKNLKLLKWMTYRQKFSEKSQSNNACQLKINSKILGLGPDFNLKIILQNTSDIPITSIKVMSLYNKQNIKFIKGPKQVSMLTPNISYTLDYRIISLSYKNQSIDFQYFYANTSAQATVHIPNCEQFADM